MSIKYFSDFIKHRLEHGHIRMGIKGKLMSISEELTMTNKVDHVMNVSRTKIPKELCIPLIEVTDKLLAHSDTGD
jgi:hypothetical protein